MTIESEIAHAAGYKRIAFPDCRDFRTLFASVEPIASYAEWQARRVGPSHAWTTDETDYLANGRTRKRKGKCQLSRFCSVDARRLNPEPDYFGLDVIPTPDTLAYISENMLIADRYTLNFSAVIRDSGTCLVTCDYDLISGGSWLALVEASTLPGALT